MTTTVERLYESLRANGFRLVEKEHLPALRTMAKRDGCRLTYNTLPTNSSLADVWLVEPDEAEVEDSLDGLASPSV